MADAIDAPQADGDVTTKNGAQTEFTSRDKFSFMSTKWMAQAREILQGCLVDAPHLNQACIRIVERLRNPPPDFPCKVGGEAILYIGIENGHAEVAYSEPAGQKSDIEIVCEWGDALRAATMHSGPELAAFRAWQMSENRIFIRGDLRPVNALLGVVHERLVEHTQRCEPLPNS